MDYLAGEDHTIDRPRDYDYWRDFTMSDVRAKVVSRS